MSWTNAIGIGFILAPLWGLILCRMCFEFMRVQRLLLGEKFGPYILGETDNRENNESNKCSNTENS
jgi:hypothetical protein